MTTRGVDPLTLRLEHPGDRILRQPIDLQVRMQSSQLASDRHVALRMAESDRRGDEESAGAAIGLVDGWVPRRALAPERALGKVAQREVEPDGLAGVGQMARARHNVQLAAAE